MSLPRKDHSGEIPTRSSPWAMPANIEFLVFLNLQLCSALCGTTLIPERCAWQDQCKLLAEAIESHVTSTLRWKLTQEEDPQTMEWMLSFAWLDAFGFQTQSTRNDAAIWTRRQQPVIDTCTAAE